MECARCIVVNVARLMSMNRRRNCFETAWNISLNFYVRRKFFYIILNVVQHINSVYHEYNQAFEDPVFRWWMFFLSFKIFAREPIKAGRQPTHLSDG
jgi:hypothetical protein